jgi:SAM-dependent methyltransferase
MNLLLTVRSRLKALEKSDRHIFRLIFRISQDGYFIFKIISDFPFRKEILSRIQFKKHYHQISHYTESDRYPDLFEICREYFKDITGIRILSFGCSTGEEVYSLGEYLPAAKITGTDISKWCIDECHKKPGNVNFEFIHSNSARFSQMDNFDAIFCLAVFQHVDNRRESKRIASLYVFSKFEEQLNILDRKLRKGGLLFIDHCDFNFFETAVSKKYSPLINEKNRIVRERPIYNRENIKILDITYTYRVFEKNY